MGMKRTAILLLLVALSLQPGQTAVGALGQESASHLVKRSVGEDNTNRRDGVLQPYLPIRH